MPPGFSTLPSAGPQEVSAKNSVRNYGAQPGRPGPRWWGRSAHGATDFGPTGKAATFPLKLRDAAFPDVTDGCFGKNSAKNGVRNYGVQADRPAPRFRWRSATRVTDFRPTGEFATSPKNFGNPHNFREPQFSTALSGGGFGRRLGCPGGLLYVPKKSTLVDYLPPHENPAKVPWKGSRSIITAAELALCGPY